MIIPGTARRLLRGGGPATAASDQTRVRALLSPTRCALLVVDVPNDFLHPSGRVGPGGAVAAELVLDAWRSG